MDKLELGALFCIDEATTVAAPETSGGVLAGMAGFDLGHRTRSVAAA
jgi:hypothetical protein